MRSDLILIYCSVPTTELGHQIGSGLLEQSLVACAHLSAAGTSIYRWEGNIQSDSEHQLILKTTTARFDAVCKFIRNHHTYEIPEIIAVPVSDVDPAYENWVLESVQL